MKILIVDDEELTRTGLISSIDWESLGITEVLQADDGVHGLETARLHKPQIILCDVRMPRMDGITMLEHLEAILPDTVPIFMSGYSDKEYLKAAIKLKAVNYIEKPLALSEVREAILEAKELYIHKVHSRQGESIHSMETASQLALCLTAPYEPGRETIQRLAGELSLNLPPAAGFTSFIIKFDNSLDLNFILQNDLFQAFEEFLKNYRLKCLHTEKRHQYLVFFVFGASRLSALNRQEIGSFLIKQYSCFGKISIAGGDNTAGIAKAYQSYASAVIVLQSSFFYPANTFLTSEMLKENPSPAFPIPSPENVFEEALLAKKQTDCKELLAQLFRYFDRNHKLLPNPVKDLYYRLFLKLESAGRQLQLPGKSSSQDSIAEEMEHCFTFYELHHILEEKTAAFFDSLQHSVQENPTIFMIKEYISENYMNETLSVKDIGDHVFLSASYVCTFFKNETGQTLNQYLTEYRMERAKQLLCNPRYKITDISSRVGYSDGNYFGKSFKKYSGVSPSEYREKMMQ